MTRVHSSLSKIQVECILGLGKIQAGIIWFYGFRVNPTGLERLFSEFFFGQNQNLGIFIT